MKSIRNLSIFLLIGIACLAMAMQAAPIKRQIKVGDQMTWRLLMEFQIWGESADYSSLITDKVVRVEPDGTYEVETTQSAYKATFAGEAADVDDKDLSKFGTVYDPTGGIKELKGSRTMAATYRVANATTVRLPDKPVAVGDSWTATSATNKDTGLLASTVTYKVIAEEKVGDFDCIKCTFNYKETEGGDPMMAQGDVWINKADGSLVNMKATWSNAPIPGSQSLLSGEVSYIREKPAG